MEKNAADTDFGKLAGLLQQYQQSKSLSMEKWAELHELASSLRDWVAVKTAEQAAQPATGELLQKVASLEAKLAAAKADVGNY